MHTLNVIKLLTLSVGGIATYCEVTSR